MEKRILVGRPQCWSLSIPQPTIIWGRMNHGGVIDVDIGM